MTVCIAAICENAYVVGASDRMITARDVQFEPEHQKILPLSNSLVVQFSGDAGMARLVYGRVFPIIAHRISIEPQRWWGVEEAALLWASNYRIEATRQAVDQLLAPLGLGLESFLLHQRELSPEVVLRVTNALQSHRAPFVEAIVAGCDPSGPHIFVVQGSDLTCSDQMGFATVGAGKWHAASQFMFAAHSTHHMLADTLWRTLFAKKHAEVAPGVGSHTDMFAVMGLGQSLSIATNIVTVIEDVYETWTKQSRRTAERAAAKIAKFLDNMTATTNPEQSSSPTGDLATGD